MSGLIVAGVAQWLESLPSKQAVVGSSPIARSIRLESIQRCTVIRLVMSSYSKQAARGLRVPSPTPFFFWSKSQVYVGYVPYV